MKQCDLQYRIFVISTHIKWTPTSHTTHFNCHLFPLEWLFCCRSLTNVINASALKMESLAVAISTGIISGGKNLPTSLTPSLESGWYSWWAASAQCRHLSTVPLPMHPAYRSVFQLSFSRPFTCFCHIRLARVSGLQTLSGKADSHIQHVEINSM